MLRRDRKAVRSVILPVSEADLTFLLKSQPYPADESGLKMFEAKVKALPIRAIKVGEYFRLPNGKTAALPAKLLGPNRALLLPKGQAVPFPLEKVQGKWRVNAMLLIISRRRAERQ